MIIPIGAGVSQAVSPVQQDFVTLVETLKAWMPMLQAQILQQNYQASVSGSGNSQKQKQEQQDTFRLQLYNYYFDKSARILPTNIQYVITRQSLQAADMVGAHLWPKSRDMVRVEAYCVCPPIDLLAKGPILLLMLCRRRPSNLTFQMSGMFETGCCGHLHSSRHIYCLISQLCTHITHELSCRAALQAWN